jgi:hypothetical protein
VDGDREGARRWLETAIAAFEEIEMRERACSLRWQLATIDGDDAARAEQERLASDLGVADLASWSRFRAPGFDCE